MASGKRNRNNNFRLPRFSIEHDPALKSYIDGMGDKYNKPTHKDIVQWSKDLENAKTRAWVILVNNPLEELTRVAKLAGLGLDDLLDSTLHADVLEKTIPHLGEFSNYRVSKRFIKEWVTVINSRNNMVKSHLPFVLNMARRYATPKMTFNDLVQEGNLGLIKAAYRFDWRKGFKFSTYCAWWIRHSIQRAIDDRGNLVKIPVYRRLQRVRVEYEASKHKAENGQVDYNKIGEALEVDADTAKWLRTLEQTPRSLDTQLPGVEQNGMTHLDLVQDENPIPDKALGLCQKAKFMRQVVDRLSDKHRYVICRRFYEGDTFSEIGADMNLSRERVRQIEVEALDIMRKVLARSGQDFDSFETA